MRNRAMDPHRPADARGYSALDIDSRYNIAPRADMHDYHALGSQPRGPNETNTTDAGQESEKTGRNVIDPLIQEKWERRNPLKDWAYELLSMTVAIGLLIAIILILRRFEDKEQPKWPHELTLNSVIAILSTILRALLASIIAEGTFRTVEK